MDPKTKQDLDDLFADAQAAERKFPSVAARRVRNATPEPAPKIAFNERYLLPEFWEPRAGICLIHRDTNSLLGNFREFVHKDGKATKWVRVEEPVQVQRTEWVSGPQWLGVERVVPTPESWTTHREVLLPDLVLHCLGVHAELVLVDVSLQFGGIARVELVGHTTLMSPDARTIITLPAGVNVLPAMDLDGKIALRKEVMA